MRHPVSRELFAYWDALRAGRAAPERSAIDPAAIRNLLAYTFLLEVGQRDASGSRPLSFRLSGTRLNALFRRDLKGGAFAGLWDKSDEASGLDLVDGVLDDCMPVVAGVRASPEDYEPVDFELMLLPLRHHGRTQARILGAIVAETVPSWIGLRPIEGLKLSTFRTILPRDGGRLGTFGLATSGAAPVVSPPLAPPVARSRVPAAIGHSPAPAGAKLRPFRVVQGGGTGAGSVSTGMTADLG